MKKIILIVCFCLFATVNGQTVTTFAGSTQGFADATGLMSQFNTPHGICPDNSGNLYIADFDNNKIRKIVIASGVVTTLAGSTQGSLDGIGTAAQFYRPHSICFDNNGNLFVSDFGNHRIRKIVISTGVVTTIAGLTVGFADGIGTLAKFNLPNGLCCDINGTNLYIADYKNYKIRKLEIATGTVSTVAGSTKGANNGIGTLAQFQGPFGVCTDFTNLYVTDSGGLIKKINLNTALVTTYVSGLYSPRNIAIDFDGFLYVSDYIISKINLSTNAITTLAGDISTSNGYADGIGPAAIFNAPIGLCKAGVNLYVADSENHKIRKIILPTLGIQKNERTTTSIYPNPNNGKFSINSNNEKVTQVSLFSLNGKLINTQKPNTLNPEIALPEISKGMYLVNIILESGSVSKSKIIIE